MQNIQFGLSPSLTQAIKSIPRWRLVQAALPHIMHCCASLLYSRKESLDKLGKWFVVYNMSICHLQCDCCRAQFTGCLFQGVPQTNCCTHCIGFFSMLLMNVEMEWTIFNHLIICFISALFRYFGACFHYFLKHTGNIRFLMSPSPPQT